MIGKSSAAKSTARSQLWITSPGARRLVLDGQSFAYWSIPMSAFPPRRARPA